MSEPAERRWGWVVAVLVVSVGANCLLAGYILGRELLPGAVPLQSAASQPPPGANIGERLRSLPQEERQKFQEAMRPYRPDIRRAREELQDARLGLVQAITAEPYDPDRMRQAFAVVRAKAVALQERVQNATAQALGSLSASARKELVAPRP